ncbi:MAG TPA: A/G-specific adenine glycosylase [Egibacteraceae bacterium]|jgi:A/G-specific adenine glycosylase|nr:A/G-specific adenine glycosylase [Egibacteraceae bacterium]
MTSSPSDSGVVVLEGRPLRFQRLLQAWHHSESRPLPWRDTHDPYRILVSEIMLQQTQVDRVEPVYHAFLRRFPDIQTLASSPLADVVRAWQGLGYNRRAVSLHRAARAVVERHGGRVPFDLLSLRALPGVGDYTARAVLAFAFGQDVGPVDVNVARVLARAAAGRALRRSEVQHLADTLVPPGQAATWTAGLMDLGARYCTARAPRCPACPVAAACAWRTDGGPDAGGLCDPAATTAVRTRAQQPFAGSDRYHRGRLVETLRRGPVECDALPDAADLDDTGRLAALTRSLVDDGLAEWNDGSLRLPTDSGA